jgi:hypothetical protein
MSVIALLAGERPSWSLGGTLEVIGFGALVGMPSGLVWGLVQHTVPGKPLGKGVAYGVLVFLVILLLPIQAKRAAFGFPQLLPVTVALFAGLFVVYGMVLARAVERCWRSGDLGSARGER